MSMSVDVNAPRDPKLWPASFRPKGGAAAPKRGPIHDFIAGNGAPSEDDEIEEFCSCAEPVIGDPMKAGPFCQCPPKGPFCKCPPKVSGPMSPEAAAALRAKLSPQLKEVYGLTP